MAQEGEHERGCGFRKVGGKYLVGGDGWWDHCDRLPYALLTCKACGTGIHLPRTPQEIIPSEFFGNHDPLEDCKCWQEKQYACPVCMPDNEPGYLITVGESNYPTPAAFAEEAHKMGISKRIHQIPRHLKLGETVIYLGHPHACGKGQPGVFMTFIPRRIEQLVWEKDMEKMKEELEKKGISPVPIKDGDPDHFPAAPNTKHYHILVSRMYGTLNENWLDKLWDTQALAREALHAFMESLRDEGGKVTGSMSSGYSVLAKDDAPDDPTIYTVIKCVDASHVEEKE